MIVRIYEVLWLAIVLVGALLFVAGQLTLTVGLVLGFVAFGMVFMGMMGVLPATISRPTPAKPIDSDHLVESPAKGRHRVHHPAHGAHA